MQKGTAKDPFVLWPSFLFQKHEETCFFGKYLAKTNQPMKQPKHAAFPQDGVTEIPLERWDVEIYFDEDAEAPGMMTAPGRGDRCMVRGGGGGKMVTG